MKYLLVFAVLFLALWIWRKNRRDTLREKPPPASAAPRVGPPQPMLRCAHCGVHLPAQDAVHASGRSYCSSAHRQAAER